MALAGEYLHFRCSWHAIPGYFEPGKDKHARGGFAAKCEIAGCENRGLAYWYRGAQFAKLPTEKVEAIVYG